MLFRFAPALSDVVDVTFVAILLYALIVGLRGARSYLPLAGIAMLGVVYLVARQLGLALTATLFQAFFAVSVLVLVVVFQREIRQFLERVAVVGGLGNARSTAVAGGPLETLVRVARELAETKRGALVVLPGRDPVDSHLAGGIALEGELSFPLLVALFDPHSPGHDGAIVIEGERVRRFAAHLPLSTNFEQLRLRGTRHAAALGLSERTDALCIVVSEERGSVSVARHGALRELGQPAELAPVLRAFAEERTPLVARGGIARRLAARWRELLAASAGSVLLWVLVVPGAEVAELDLEVPVSLGEIPPEYEVTAVEPSRVQVRVSGLRRELFLLDAADVRVELDGYLVELGRRSFELSPEDVRVPMGVSAVGVVPDKVRLTVNRRPEPAR